MTPRNQRQLYIAALEARSSGVDSLYISGMAASGQRWHIRRAAAPVYILSGLRSARRHSA
jgi:hypothetical protein